MRPEMCETDYAKPSAEEIGGKTLAPNTSLVEAVRFLPPHNCNEIKWFVGLDTVDCDGTCVPGQTFRIPGTHTPVGKDNLVAQPGDWIIRHDLVTYTVRTHSAVVQGWVEIAPWEVD